MNNKNCWDCVHRDVCASVEAGFSRCVEDVSKCKHFMDKSDFEPVRHSFWKFNNFFCPNLGECDICGYEHYNADELKYCPNCGAKMDGKEV